jgi:DNA-binding transcriptional ArsR family regulator
LTLADPTRRTIVELLSQGDLSAGELAAHFSTSRPGISRHLRVLRGHGLVRVRAEAQWRLYSLDPEPLADLEAWLARHRSCWSQRLDALETEVARAS